MIDNLYGIDHTLVSYEDAMIRKVNMEPGFALKCDKCGRFVEGVIFRGVVGKICAPCLTGSSDFWEVA